MLGYLWFELILVSYSQLALYPLTLKHAFQKDKFRMQDTIYILHLATFQKILLSALEVGQFEAYVWSIVTLFENH